jgi:chromosome segregation ATPase
MLGTMTIVLALLALAAAVFAIGWLSKVNGHLSELGRRVLDSQDIGRINEAASKTETFESRMAGCERKADEGQKQLVENKTKLNELAAKAGSVEQTAKKNEACLTELVPNIKALADEIQTIKKFQTATEKVHSLIQSALTDMQASMNHPEGLGTALEAAKPKEASEGPEEWWQEETDDQKTSGSPVSNPKPEFLS